MISPVWSKNCDDHKNKALSRAVTTGATEIPSMCRSETAVGCFESRAERSVSGPGREAAAHRTRRERRAEYRLRRQNPMNRARFPSPRGVDVAQGVINRAHPTEACATEGCGVTPSNRRGTGSSSLFGCFRSIKPRSAASRERLRDYWLEPEKRNPYLPALRLSSVSSTLPSDEPQTLTGY